MSCCRAVCLAGLPSEDREADRLRRPAARTLPMTPVPWGSRPARGSCHGPSRFLPTRLAGAKDGKAGSHRQGEDDAGGDAVHGPACTNPPDSGIVVGSALAGTTLGVPCEGESLY